MIGRWPRSESLIQTALESVSFGLDFRDCALTETVEPQLDHRLRCCRVLRDAQKHGYRSACVGLITSLSDGIENLVLDHRERIAPAPFFERLLQPVATWEGSGRSRKLSKHLRDFLGSERVCAATDDDKPLILGARM